MPKYSLDRTVSWGEFLHVAEHGPFTENSAHTREPGNFDDYTSFADALRLARDGWSDGVARIQPITMKLADRLVRHIETVTWRHDIEPAQLDVAAYLQGEPECWLCPSLRLVAAQGTLVHIILNGAVSGGNSAERITRAGAHALALVDLLERSGHGVRVSWAAGADWGRSHTRTLVHIKEHGEFLNIGRLAFVLAHAGMLRRLWWAYAETWPKHIRENTAVGLGSPVSFSPADFPGAVLVNLNDNYSCTESWVLEQLEAQGVSLKTEVLP